jgi:molecular chaperone HtpG
MSNRTETHRFQAEAGEVLDLMIHSLYKHKEIFLRELVSNAADAISKRRIESLREPALSLPEGGGRIRIETIPRSRTLCVHDDGIGMSREELIEHLGTIARSGTKAFQQALKSAGQANSASPAELIGQFGVGFYSTFLVAEEVEVVSRRAGAAEAWRFVSAGKSEFRIEPAERAEPGTTVSLRVRAAREESEADEAEPDWLDEDLVRGIVKRWSDFVEWPIFLGDEQINSMRPLWTRSRDEIKPEEYQEFYRQLTHDWRDPRLWVHFRAEGTSEYTALLYVPEERLGDPIEAMRGKSRLSLYVKRVRILDEAPELLPDWLRFVRGLVDASDLPLNVSREVLQANPAVRAIRKRLVRRLLDELSRVLQEDRSRYEAFFERFGSFLKEGVYAGEDDEKRLEKLLLFETTREGARSSLAEVAARLPAGQKQIPYLVGPDRATLMGSPQLELLTKKGIEVLLFTEPIDEFLVPRIGSVDNHPLVPCEQAARELVGSAEKEAMEALDREQRELLSAMETQLKDNISSVRFSARLSESPAALSSEKGGLSPHMERMLKAAGQPVPEQRRCLELNPEHGLVKRLLQEPAGTRREELIEVLHGQAQLSEGTPLADPGRFARLVGRLLA